MLSALKLITRFKRSLTAAGIVFLLLASYMIYMEEQGNFHTITPGEAYRSAQMDEDELEYYFQRYGIRSVINLRGAWKGRHWYEQEKEVCLRSNVKHYDLKLTPEREPSRQRIEDLLCLFREAPRPVLIHCQSGADRTGLAAAIWKVVVDGQPKSEGEKQLSIRYGHLPLGPNMVFDKFFKSWEPEQANIKTVSDRCGM